MKLRDRMLWMVVVAATGFAGCAVCDTCDDFPTPCVGPNCGGPYGMGGGQGDAVMGTSSPVERGMNDSAGPGPMMPATENPMLTPSAPPVDPTMPAAR